MLSQHVLGPGRAQPAAGRHDGGGGGWWGEARACAVMARGARVCVSVVGSYRGGGDAHCSLDRDVHRASGDLHHASQ